MDRVIRKNTLTGEARLSAYLHTRAVGLGVPLAGTFELTGRCNFSCKMCYVHQHSCKASDEMTARQWIELGQVCRDAGMFFLLLTGGEPFLRKDFTEIYVALYKMGLMISINTNGSLLTDELLETFRQYPPTRLNVSLYGGCAQTYRDLCGVGSFSTVMENLRRMKQAGLTVKLNSAITPDNAQDIAQIYSLAEQLQCPVQAVTYMFPPVRINNCQYGQAPARFTAEDAARYQLMCREQYMTDAQLAASIHDMPDVEKECVGEVGAPIPCRAGRTTFWITWDGRMLPCGMFPTPGISIKGRSFGEVWQELRASVSRIRLSAECSQCEQLPNCPACAASSLAETGATDQKPDYICRMTAKLNQLTKEKYGEVDHEAES